MGKTFKTKIKLGAEFDKRFSPTMSAAEKHLAKLAKSAEGLKKAAVAGKRFEALGGEVKKAEAAFSEARAELDRLGAELKATENPSDELKAKFKAQQKATKDAERALERKRNSLRKLEGELKEAGVDTARLGDEQKRLARQFQRTQLRMEGLSQLSKAKLGPSLRKLGSEVKDLAIAGAALAAGALWKMGREAVDAESALAKLSTAETVDAEQLKKTAAAAKAWTEAHGGDDVDYIAAAYNAVSGGITDTAASIAAVDQAQKLATATFAAAPDAMKALTKLYNNTADKSKPAADELLRLSDVLARTQAVADIADLDQLTEGLKYALPSALSFKVELQQTAAAIGALNTAGLEGSMAGTSYAQSLSRMSKAAKVLKKYDRKFEVVKDAKGGVDYLATIKAMEPALKAAEKKGKSAGDVLTKAFGQEGMRAVALLRDNIDAVIQESLVEVAGTTERAFQKMDKTTAADLARMKASWDNAFAEAGKELLPIIQQYLPDIKEGIRAIPDVLKDLLGYAEDIKAFFDSVGGVKTLLVGIGLVKLGGIASSVYGLSKNVVTAAGGIGKILESTGPMGGMIGKFTAVGMALASWGMFLDIAIDTYKEWKELTAAKETNKRIDEATASQAAALGAKRGPAVTRETEAGKAVEKTWSGLFEVAAKRERLAAVLKSRGLDESGSLAQMAARAKKAGIDRNEWQTERRGRPVAGFVGALLAPALRGAGTTIEYKPNITVQGGATAGADVERGAKAGAKDLTERVRHDEKRRSYR